MTMARALLIEDHPANLQLMAYLLKAFGHTWVAETDGESGARAAERGEFDIVLCDLHLPVLDGYAVLKRIKARAGGRAVPVVAVTAFAMAGDRERVLAAGFDGYIPKPIEPETFVSQVEAFLPAAPGSGP